MDLNLYLGPPHSTARRRTLDLGSDLALGSPAASAPYSSSSSSPPFSEEPLRGHPSAAADMAEPPFPHAPYSPSCAPFADPTDDPPPLAAEGSSLVREYSPYSPSYQSLGPPYAPIEPPPASLMVPPRGPGDPYRNFVRDGGGAVLHLPYDPLFATRPGEAALVEEGGVGGAPSHVPYSPSYVPLSVIPEDQEEVAYAEGRVFLGSSDAFVRDGGSSSRPGFLDPEFDLRRLMPLRHRSWEGRPFRAPTCRGDERRGSAAMVEGSERPVHERSISAASAGISRKSKAGDEAVAGEDVEEEKEERNASAVNFECNICLELAKEPVVTPCGHLFCWPCLYQWLHLHCHYNECPVCKGEVMDSEITPIYGRGSSTQGRLEEEEEEEDNGNLGLKIPPRPHGRRSESWRQRLQRPISRRFGVEIANSWRRLLGEEIQVGGMIDVDEDPSLQQIIGVESTMMAGRSTRVGENMENGYYNNVGRSLPSRNTSSSLHTDSSSASILRAGFDEIFARISSNSLDRGSSSVAIAVAPSRILARTDGGANHVGASSPLLNIRNGAGGSIPRPSVGSSQAVGQASASSTMAVIQEDLGFVDAAPEPNSAGSSRHPRIRGRSSSSFYVDGCSIHARLRRRRN